MKVKELIEKLKEFPQDLEICVEQINWDVDFSCSYDVYQTEVYNEDKEYYNDENDYSNWYENIVVISDNKSEIERRKKVLIEKFRSEWVITEVNKDFKWQWLLEWFIF